MGNFVTNSKIYTPAEIKEFIKASLSNPKLAMKRENKAKVALYNIPCAFDIETTSFYDKGEKNAIMYEWTLGINGHVMIGRAWPEYIKVIDTIAKYLHLHPIYKRLVIYIHNFSFEFQFMRKYFTWEKVFSIEPRKPLYAITDKGIEYRCSFLLSGYALAKLPEELQKYKVEKMVGDLDYSLMRHKDTILTDKELKYCENDVRVIMAYIQEKIEKEKNISKIPLTKTGYVRQYCRNSCLYEDTNHKKGVGKYKNYQDLIKHLTLDIKTNEYQQLKRAFQGGFTHANAYYSEQTLENVASYDFTSSYPYVMIAEKFPMSKGKIIQLKSKEHLQECLDKYCCVFDVVFYNIMTKINFENVISESRCFKLVNPVIDNGRVVCADELAITLTEIDFSIINKAYTYSSKTTFYNFRIYQKGYLPTDFVKSILKLYSDKTTLKGVAGKEVEYLMGKSMLNSTYGMCVTDICRDENIYYSNTHTWETVEVKDMSDETIAEKIKKYNKDIKRFLFYAWGVWITAYARRNLFTGIFEFQNDYVYSDTDSIKVFNHEKHKQYIEAYNNSCREKLKTACEYHNIDFSLVEPATIKGVKKLLGIWDFEGIYSKFKTLGAKRYLVEKNGKYELTVSGVDKTSAIAYLIEKYGNDIFNAFDNHLYIPKDHTGKNTHTYLDDTMQGELTDYNGIKCPYMEASGVHIEKADYDLTMSVTYLEYLQGIRYAEK